MRPTQDGPALPLGPVEPVTARNAKKQTYRVFTITDAKGKVWSANSIGEVCVSELNNRHLRALKPLGPLSDDPTTLIHVVEDAEGRTMLRTVCYLPLTEVQIADLERGKEPTPSRKRESDSWPGKL